MCRPFRPDSLCLMDPVVITTGKGCIGLRPGAVVIKEAADTT